MKLKSQTCVESINTLLHDCFGSIIQKLKEIVHLKMKSHLLTLMSLQTFVCLKQKMLLKMFQSFFYLYNESQLGPMLFLTFIVWTNIFFCVPHETESLTGLDMRVSK